MVGVNTCFKVNIKYIGMKKIVMNFCTVFDLSKLVISAIVLNIGYNINKVKAPIVGHLN